MKKNTSLLATIALLAFSLPLIATAATQVYDLNMDWSDTQNPNGTWSYRRLSDGGLLVNYPFPWVDNDFVNEAITKVTASSVVPGSLELGDVFIPTLNSGLTVRWTAPANGTINVSGDIWDGSPDEDGISIGGQVSWTLRHNGSLLSGGQFTWLAPPRSSPYQLSSGSGGANALQIISVHAGDLIEMGYIPEGFGASGINFTITLTPDSVDPVTAIEDLAIAVFEMNLQNGIENSLDSKLDAALNALVDANVNNDGAACNSLAAFINAVEAQRGNKITNVQADRLIAAAHQIQAMLGCGN